MSDPEDPREMLRQYNLTRDDLSEDAKEFYDHWLALDDRDRELNKDLARRRGL
jgi:hypothetical protein